MCIGSKFNYSDLDSSNYTVEDVKKYLLDEFKFSPKIVFRV
jgi:hypothetical protein